MTTQRPAALVTGAATGIGRSAVLALARAGYDVAETMMTLIRSNRFVTGEVIVIDGGFASST